MKSKKNIIIISVIIVSTIFLLSFFNKSNKTNNSLNDIYTESNNKSVDDFEKFITNQIIKREEKNVPKEIKIICQKDFIKDNTNEKIVVAALKDNKNNVLFSKLRIDMNNNNEIIDYNCFPIDKTTNYYRFTEIGSLSKGVEDYIIIGGYINNSNIKSMKLNFKNKAINLLPIDDNYFCYIAPYDNSSYEGTDALDKNLNIIPYKYEF